ncbi:RICIN domain-containing protein [Kitasatospora sp. MY 5-36]|uniref:RICIN domain-containing protein n=1 Tax=Kitasatospora sp. MY 5-36 TaxID=1678027 RepID=UPI000AB33C9B|nr:RICIN domain-containing protein [Kitasatospora sp. MY 5-36]
MSFPARPRTRPSAWPATVAALLSLSGIWTGAVTAEAVPTPSALPAAAGITATGQTPGAYSDWTFNTTDTVTDVDFRNTVVTSPGDGDLQFKDGTEGSHCWNNEGEGQHLQCSNTTVNHGRPVTGDTYAFHVEIDPVTHWAKVTVSDETAGTSFVLGEALLPNSSKIQHSWSSWVEYFDWNDSRYVCDDNAYAENRWGKMTGNGGTLTAENTGTSTSGTCQDMVRQQKQDDGTLITETGLGQSARWPLRFTNGACLDRGGATGVITYGCAESPNGNQLFVFARDGSMRSAEGNECLTAPSSVGGQITPAACDGSAAQQWTYDVMNAAVVNSAGWAMTSSTSGGSGDPVTAQAFDGRAEQTITPFEV